MCTNVYVYVSLSGSIKQYQRKVSTLVDVSQRLQLCKSTIHIQSRKVVRKVEVSINDM